eukprot:gb/GECG01012225.1/.p1 GENE.gb/GECG01012225.1/~~gb/GECG01012225.1/.p1  ORF type:complete len:142 (+),score=14.61 gb/GECG01012225.1/:1-426(+)
MMAPFHRQISLNKLVCAQFLMLIVLLDALGDQILNRFPGALALEPGLPPKKVPQTQEEIRLHNQKILKLRREKSIKEWKEQKEKSQFRKEKQLCDADGFCRPIGVFASFRRGHGVMFCRDCSNSFIHGAFGKSMPMHAFRE